MNADVISKIVMVGDSAVGKTNLGLRFTKNIFRTDYNVTLGAEFAAKTAVIDDQEVTLQIWDTAGEERFRAVTSMFFRNAVGALAVYDITSQTSFENVELWLQLLNEHCGDDVIVVLVGNKSDQNNLRRVSFEEGQQLAQQLSLSFIETSALNGSNVEAAFETLVKEIRQQARHQASRQSVLLRKPLPKKTRRCYC